MYVPILLHSMLCTMSVYTLFISRRNSALISRYLYIVLLMTKVMSLHTLFFTLFML